MERFIEKASRKFVLLVSLYDNDPKLAEIAQGCGADAVKVHINVLHHASKTNFKSWPEEKKKITEIVKNVNIPAGIVPGGEDKVASYEEMLEIEAAGFDFWDIFAHHAPSYLFNLKNMSKMMAVNYQYNLDCLPELEDLGVEILETSIINPDEYGRLLSAKDLSYYKYLIKKISIPAVVPTQRGIKPGELDYLMQAGAQGIGIGAVVTGKDYDTYEKTVRSFAQKIKELNDIYEKI
ncbi:MAG: hypothetical protein ABIH00_05640 [Armatimonadota bacterium]